MSAVERPRLLFVCSRNRRRSLTAERLLRRSSMCEVRSAGTASSARIRVQESTVEWADVIYAMEPTHVEQLRQRFGSLLAERTFVCLDIPDEYEYMDPELVEILSRALDDFLPQ
ncbi:MAG: Methyltransferase type 11 [Thermoleophilia bacterium]|nr:Methyltransferase type 11 [Thermoleophilia bacterium]